MKLRDLAPSRLEPGHAVALIIAISFVLRAGLAGVTGFSFDESYDVVAARSVALGYYDHPPLAMWLIASAVRLFGSEDNLVVRLPTLLLFGGTTFFIYRLTRLLFTPAAAVIAALILNLSPMFGVFAGTIAVTDGPLLFGLAAAAYFLAEALFGGEDRAVRRWWLLAGASFGLAALAKYSAVLSIPGVLIFLLTAPGYRRWLLRPEPYLAAVTALVVLSPAILWNVRHDWTSIAFQTRRAAFDGDIHAIRLLEYLAFVALFILPTVWTGLIVSLLDGLRRGPTDLRRWFPSCLAVVPIVFFAAIWLIGDRTRLAGGYHWSAPGYLFAFPLLGSALADLAGSMHARRMIGISAAVVAALYLGFASDAVTGWMGALVPQFREHDPLVADQTDWWSLRSALAEWHMLDRNRYFVIAGRYELCFKAELVLNGALPVVCLTANPIGQALWTDMPTLRGRDAIIITTWWNAPVGVDAVKAEFATVERLPTLSVTSFGVSRAKVDLLVGHRLTNTVPMMAH